MQVEFLQTKTELKRERQLLTASGKLRECRRVDASLLSADDFKSIREPVLLENAFELLDNTTWARSEFGKDGTHGMLTMNARNVLHNEAVTYHHLAYDTLSMYMHEAIDYNTSSVLWLYPEQAEGLVSELKMKNNGFFPNAEVGPFPLATLFKIMQPDYSITMENQGQWIRTHTHAESTFVQVSGRKGWLFGDSSAFDKTSQIIADMSDSKGPIKDSVLSREDLCNIFFNGRLPQHVAERSTSFVTCESAPGEAVFWPGLCGGECGWWHGTCGLEAWNIGFNHLGYRDRNLSSHGHVWAT